MNQLAAAHPDAADAIAPVLERLARELPRADPDGRVPHEAKDDLLSELLDYAAAAEQQLADQRRRIAYLEGLAMTDELTGLANRRGFEAFLRQTLSAARRHEESGVIGFFDLDEFKTVNDRFGHAVGDAALAHVGRILAEGVRGIDCAARLGGDEFAVVLVRCRPSGALRRLQTLRERIARTPFRSEGRSVALSSSLGACAFDSTRGMRDLLFAADRAMYQDKRRRKPQAA